MDMGSFHFIRPWWWVALPVVLWLWWQTRHASAALAGWRQLMDPHLLRVLTVGRAGDTWKEYLVVMGWILGIVALAGPTWRPEPSPFADDPVPVMLLLKADASMDLSDLTPSRMERARLKVADLAEARPGKPLGLIAFAGSAHLVLPPTRDTAVVAKMASEISSQIMPRPGEDLLAAIQLAEQTWSESQGVLLVLADRLAIDQREELARWRKTSRTPVSILALARAETPEADSIVAVSKSLHADVTWLTPDDRDLQTVLTQVQQAGQFVATAGDGTRWAEAGYWLSPVVALLMLLGFRREQTGEARKR